MNDNYEVVTWDDVEEFISAVCTSILSNEAFQNRQISGVYGLPRGGLIFAVMLSHRLNIPLLMAPAKNCIIVDDICDSGESLLHYVRNSSGDKRNEYITITMYMKQNELVHPDIYYKVKSDKWILFPWETL